MDEPFTGTTVLAAVYKGGVVLGADSRVTTGAYISNRASEKITPLAENIWLLRSGSAADTQAIADYGVPPNFHTYTCTPVLIYVEQSICCSQKPCRPAAPDRRFETDSQGRG